MLEKAIPGSRNLGCSRLGVLKAGATRGRSKGTECGRAGVRGKMDFGLGQSHSPSSFNPVAPLGLSDLYTVRGLVFHLLSEAFPFTSARSK